MVTGDRALGWLPQGAPHDRVPATVAARIIPPAWVAQTRLGGLVLVPVACRDHGAASSGWFSRGMCVWFGSGTRQADTSISANIRLLV